MLRRLSQAMLEYYFALRLNAAASLPHSFGVDQLISPAPIVRSSTAAMVGEWDRRELLMNEDVRAVLTLPMTDSGARSSPVIVNN